MSEKEKPALFLRRASGLVRVWDPLDMFLFNFISAPLVTYGLFFALTAAFIPEGDQVMGWIISLLPFLALCVVYAMAGVTMPHAGGEYLYVSRTFGGAHGFSLSLVGSIWPQLFWGPIAGITINYMVLTPVSYYLGTIYGLTSLIALSQWLPTITGTLVVTLICSTYTLLFDSLGMRVYRTVQRFCSIFGYASLVVISAVFLYYYGQRDYFIANFNALVQQNQGVSNAYQLVLDKAAATGFNAAPSITLMGTLLVAPMAFLMYYTVLFGAPVIGEMKAADDVKKQLFTLAGPAIMVCIFAAFTLFTTFGILGREFMNAYCYLWQTGQSPVGLPPYYLSFFIVLLKDQPLVVVLTLIGYCLMFIVAWVPNLYIPPSRYMFAWSFDRTFPAKIAELKGNAHTPVYAFLTMYVATIIVLLLFAFTPFGGFTVSIGLAAAIMSLGLAFVAVVLPYKKKELWESSPAALYKIGGIPLMVIMGVISIVYLLVMIIEYIINPVYGLNNQLALGFLLGLYIAAYIAYYLVQWYRRRTGFDLSKVYGEIPSA
jgi:amino acid transporter